MAHKRWTDLELTEAVNSSGSIRQVLIKLGLAPKGGSYATVKRALIRLGLNTDHFYGQAWNRGRKQGPKRPTEAYLKNDGPYIISSHKLRLRLLAEDFFSHKCYECGRKTWLGEPIPLELEHIDGNSKNNEPKNLTLLCPNCHALTPTYRGKNIK